MWCLQFLAKLTFFARFYTKKTGIFINKLALFNAFFFCSVCGLSVTVLETKTVNSKWRISPAGLPPLSVHFARLHELSASPGMYFNILTSYQSAFREGFFHHQFSCTGFRAGSHSIFPLALRVHRKNSGCVQSLLIVLFSRWCDLYLHN